MTQRELLKETERAAGDRRLTKWHEALITNQGAHQRLQEDLDRQSEKLKRRETKQVESEKEVQQFQQRRELEEKLAILQLLIMYARYNKKREEYEEAKGMRNEAQEQLKELEAANVPFRESENALKAIVKHFNTLKAQVHSKTRETNKEIKKKTEEISNSEAAADTARSALKDLAMEERSRKEAVKTLKAEIAMLERKTQKEPEKVDPLPIKKEMAAKNDEISVLKEQFTDKSGEARTANTDLERLSKDEKHLQQRLARTSDLVHQREKSLQHFEPDTWKAVQWMRENKHLFKGKVHEPARLTVFAKRNDVQTLSLIEGPIALHAWKTFLFEEREDYDLMMYELGDRRKWRINGAEIGRDRSPDQSKARLSIEQCQTIGFDFTAIDMLQGPAPVLAYLCDEHSGGRVPLQYKRRPVASLQELAKLNVRMYYTLDGSHVIRQAKYGQRHAQMEQRSLNPAKILSSGGDSSQTDQMQQDLARIIAEKSERTAVIEQAQAVMRDLNSRIDVLERERMQLDQRRKDLTKPILAYQRHKLELEQKKQALEKREKQPSGETKRKQLQDKLVKITNKRVELVLQLKQYASKLMILQADYTEVMLRGMQADTDLAAMKNSSSELDRLMNEKKQYCEELAAGMKKAKKDALEAINTINEATETASPEVLAASEQRREEEDLNLDSLIEEEGAIQAQINMTSNISEQVLRKYEELLKEIAELKEKVKEAEARLEASTTGIKQIEDRWLPRLRALVKKIAEKFKEAFDKLGVLSDIQLDETGDYDKWGIKILVSFRDNEPLQVLTAQRQSGGERALTTVMYLMSLAELAQSPFALVDEINQGMDKRVERSVHNALVQTTCKDDVGQYFLLTPKLLPDLDYHSKMKVLVINAGTYLPPKLSLANVVKQKNIRNRQQPQQGARAAVAAH
ncbi:Structural maintenance of chromosomes protein 5 [Microbotryomycetes sp. JL201]|nr:Structural maintenance of chromosomes protein 5 [Microbotryomycetes sp. JL201]